MVGGGTQLVDVENDPMIVYIMFGQSNMVGHAVKNEFHESYLVPSESCLRLEVSPTLNGWYMQEPKDGFLYTDNLKKYATGNGAEISFAKILSDELARSVDNLCSRIGILKVAMGSTSIRAFLPPADHAYCEEAAYTYEKAYETYDEDKGPLYQLIKEKIDVTNQLIGQNPGIRYGGIIMKMGAHDWHLISTASSFIWNVRHVVEQIRIDTGVPDLPFIVATYWPDAELREMGRVKVSDICQDGPYAYDVLMSQATADDIIDNTRVVFHRWLPVCPDKMHFNTKSHEAFGRILASSALSEYLLIRYPPIPDRS
jgi:hypothetical protein